MLRKILLALIVVVLVSVLFIGWRFFMSATSFDEKTRYLYIRTGEANEAAVLKSLDTLISDPGSFRFLANRVDVWENLSPGKYEIKKGTSLWTLARILRNRQQSPVNLVITKIRTKENFAALVGRKFESDSLAIISYMNNPDTLKHYGLDTITINAGHGVFLVFCICLFLHY